MAYEDEHFPTLQEFLDSEWFKSRPKSVQETARRYPPGRYRFNEDGSHPGQLAGQEALLYCYEEGEHGQCDSVKVRLDSQKIVSVCVDHLEPVDTLK